MNRHTLFIFSAVLKRKNLQNVVGIFNLFEFGNMHSTSGKNVDTLD